MLALMVLMLLFDKLAEARETEPSLVLSKTQAASQANLNCDRANCTGNNHLASFEHTFTFTKSEEAPSFDGGVSLTAPDGQLEPEAYPNLERTPEGHLILEFTEEESEAASELFGCNCIKSINALRQLRGFAIGVEAG